MQGLSTRLDEASTAISSEITSRQEQHVSVQVVIMAGGSGTRLWPLSREQYPKQFLALSGKNTLLQQAVIRGAGINGQSSPGSPVVVGNEAHRFMLQEQLREIGTAHPRLLLEPSGRNTAPALTLAALCAREEGADPVLVVMPSDQTIKNEAAFEAAAQEAVAIAAQGAIVMLGIAADRPETGYGYIAATPTADAGVLRVVSFKEKPDAETAIRYVADGSYYWNSGIFVLQASTWLDSLQQYQPEMLQACIASWRARSVDGGFIRPGSAEFGKIEADSIDCAVIERCVGGRWPLMMTPLQAGWSDLGVWESVWQVAEKDDRGNASQGDVLIHDSTNVLVHSTSRLVGVVGLEDVVVVETPDAVMVTSRAQSQNVKQVVAALAQCERGEHRSHRRVQRPWGWYDSIDMGPRFQVKRIVVSPGASLSLQMHHHRAEHWIVVSGTAAVTCGQETVLLSENQSTYIPLGQVHRLANPGKLDLEIIEVQSGSYLGEDDIVRFEDVYGRG